MTVPTPAAKAPPLRQASAEIAALADRLRVTIIRLSRQLRRQDAPGLHITLYSALATLAYRGELALGELAEAEHVPSSAATRIADKLEKAGYAVRKPNPLDRRGVNLAITTEGQRVVSTRRRQGNAWLADRMARLDDSQRAVLADALDILNAVVIGDDGPPVLSSSATDPGKETR